MMVEVQVELLWKVSYGSKTSVSYNSYIILLGDVMLSAEDHPPPLFVPRKIAVAPLATPEPQTPSHHDEIEYGDADEFEEHEEVRGSSTST